MEKQEKRERIQKLINTYIKKGSYGEFTDIISEIIERRYLVFDSAMDEKRVEEELKAFVKYLKRIRYANERDYRVHSSNTLGYYSNKRKEIVLLDKNIINPEQLYNILTHEIYHALATNEKGNTALEFYNEENNETVGTALNESINEYGAYLAYSLHRRAVENAYGVHTTGYNTLIFAPRLLAAAFGIPETTLVGEGLKGRGNLFELLYRNENVLKDVNKEKRKQALDEFEKFEANLNILYNLDYTTKYFSKEEIEQLRATTANEMIDYTLSQLKKMIEANIRNYIPTDEEDIKKFAYCFYKIEEISNGAFSDPKVKDMILQKMIDRRKQEGYLITDINKIVRVRNQIGNENDYYKYLKLASQGKVDVAIDEIKEKYNIEISKEKEFIGRTIRKEDAYNSSFAKFMEEVDYVEDERLDRKRIENIYKISEIISKRYRQKNFFSIIINRLNGLFNPQKRLPEGEEEKRNVKEEKEESDNTENKFLEKLRAMTTIEKENKDFEQINKNEKEEIVNPSNRREKRKSEEDKEL